MVRDPVRLPSMEEGEGVGVGVEEPPPTTPPPLGDSVPVVVGVTVWECVRVAAGVGEREAPPGGDAVEEEEKEVEGV